MSIKEKYNLVFDQGGHATRAVVFDENSQIVQFVESPIKTYQYDELFVEHDANQLIESFHDVLSQLSSHMGDDFNKIAAAGIATQRSSFVCWDKISRQALTPVISWQDRRTVNDIKKYQSHQDEIHQKTGLYLNPHYGASKMRWCLDHIDAVYQAQKNQRLCIGPLSSYILFQLLEGHPFVCDPANASRTLLMNYKTLQWDESLNILFSISQQLLPKILSTRAVYGKLSYKNVEIPVMLSTGDQSASVYSSGQPSVGRIYANVGTGAFVQNVSHEIPDIEHNRLLASVVFTSDNEKTYALEGTVNGAGRALQWLAEKNNVKHYEAQLDVWCEQFQSPTLFLNGVSGVGSPFWKADLQSRFVDEVSTPEKFVAVLESIVFLMYMNIKLMLVQHPLVEQISISGGVGKSNALCQKLADLSGIVVVRDEQSEATAKGVQFLLSGKASHSDIQPSEFEPLENRLLFARFEKWQALMNEN